MDGDVSTGPRYCPSIEDKIVRFAGKTSHQIFLEPEGEQSREIYVQGMSTSLPEEAAGYCAPSKAWKKEWAGYTIEYDYILPTQLHRTLETKKIPACIPPARSTAAQAMRSMPKADGGSMPL